MKTVSGKYGICYFQDCVEGMKSIQPQTWDLCLTDYPFNVKFKGKVFGGLAYEDNKSDDEYLAFCQTTFAEIQRVSKSQLIFCGNPNLNMWIKYIAEPKDIMIHYAPNRECRGNGFKLAKHDFGLLYGEILLGASVFKINIEYQDMPNHPCPNNPKLYRALIQSSKKTSVIDPFLGSGTTAQVCEELGISWLGFELSEAYLPDITKRIQRGMRDHEAYRKTPKKQLTLLG